MKYLKTFESYSVSEEYSERQDMIDMLVSDRDCVYSEEELQSMSDEELSYMCSSNESLKDFGKKVLVKLGLMDKDEEVEKRKEKIISNLESMIEKDYDKFTYDGDKVKDQEELVTKMAKSGFVGRLLPIQSKGIVNYKPGAYKFARLGSAGAEKGR
jgi:hypothetical protein